MKPVLALLILLAPGIATAQTDDELYAAAKAEGVVNFAGALKQKETEGILRDFEKRYPGIRVTYRPELVWGFSCQAISARLGVGS